MPNISEKIELLGKGLYEKIPNQLTLKTMPTLSELDYVGSEDFDKVMVTKILPQCVEETGFNFEDLLEIDYQWICRCLRILNYGPYHTTNAVFCGECGEATYGEFQVDLRNINCVPLPNGFINKITIKRDEFIDFDGDIVLSLPTIRDIMNMNKDESFKKADGTTNLELARICYMLKSMGTDTNLNPIETRMAIEQKLSPADYKILVSVVNDFTDYGLRAGGHCHCPKCQSDKGSFFALPDDRFFRPTLGDLRKWRDDKSSNRGN